MKTITGQKIPDIYEPAPGGKFPKTREAEAPRKRYIVLTTLGMQFLINPRLRAEGARKPATAESPLGLDHIMVETEGKKERAQILRVLAGPFRTAEERDAAVPEAKRREKLWGAVTYDNTRERGRMGYVHSVAFPTAYKSEERKESEEYVLSKDEEFEIQ